MLAARQLLAEQLGAAASRLPLGVGPPRLSPLTSATMDVLKIGLVSETRSPMELRALADWTLRPRLLIVPGVARVNVFGGDVRQLQIQVHPQALIAHGLALGDVVAAARDAVAVRGAGFVETANQRITLAADGEPASAQALGETPIVARDGAAAAPRRRGRRAWRRRRRSSATRWCRAGPACCSRSRASGAPTRWT